MASSHWLRGGPGHIALALFLSVAAGPAIAQPGPPASLVPVPDALQLAKLVWSTMAAIDDANRAGNYSVLRDLGAPGFQQNNDSAKLAQVFASLRAQNIDLGNTLLLAPTWAAPPTLVEAGVMRLRGYFGLRPVAISFDLYYQWSQGRWKLFGVAIEPQPLAQIQPAARPTGRR